MENTLNILKKNSIALEEGITSADIADSDEIVSAIISQKYIDSLAYQICDVQPIHGPTGSTFAVKYGGAITAVKQLNTITVGSVLDSTLYTVTINGTAFDYTSGVGATEAQIVTGLVTAINLGAEPVTAVDNTTNLTIEADVAGTPFTIAVTANLTNTETTANVVAKVTRTIVDKNNVSVENDAITNTGFTLEAIQDMQNEFGKDAIDFIGRAFSGVSASAENTKLIAKMNAIAKDKGTLTLSAPANAETVFFEVAQKVSESIIEINSKHYRSMDAFVVLPLKAASAVMGLGVYFNDSIDNEAGLFLGKIRRTKYYINPDPTSTTAYVGINGTAPGTSSLIFSPYQHALMTAVDPDTGNTNVFNVNRYAITENAMSEVDDEMLHKFTVAVA